VNSQNRPSLLLDIQAKIQEGAGAGYVQWMKIFNIKSAAHTLIFLKENGIDSYDELCEKASTASSDYYQISSRLKEIETRQKEINELQRYIGHYGKTRAAWERYKKSDYDAAFFEAERAELTLHKTAKDYFNAQGFKGKLPSINSLKAEWTTLESERRQLSPKYKPAQEKYLALCTAKTNADIMLFGERKPSQRTHNHNAR
jgi:hypothetical protein